MSVLQHVCFWCECVCVYVLLQGCRVDKAVKSKVWGPRALLECCALEVVLSLWRRANGGHPALMNSTQSGRMERKRSCGDAAVIEAAAEREKKKRAQF